MAAAHEPDRTWIPGTVLGSALAFLLLIQARPCGGKGSVAILGADRGAGRVVALDGDLCSVHEVRLRSPRRVLAAADGGAWVLCSGARPDTDLLVRLDRTLAPVREFSFGPLHGLCASGPDEVLAIEGSPEGPGILWRIGSSGRRAWLAFPGARRVACSGSRVLIACAGGELLLCEAQEPSSVLSWVTLEAEPVDVAPGPRERTWWALIGAGNTRLLLLEERSGALGLETCWSASTGGACERLAPARGQERVWVADPSRSALRCFGPGGALELELADLPAREAGTALLPRANGVLVGTPGALLEIEATRLGAPSARLARTQGGYDELVDLAGFPALATPGGRPAGSIR